MEIISDISSSIAENIFKTRTSKIIAVKCVVFNKMVIEFIILDCRISL